MPRACTGSTWSKTRAPTRTPCGVSSPLDHNGRSASFPYLTSLAVILELRRLEQVCGKLRTVIGVQNHLLTSIRRASGVAVPCVHPPLAAVASLVRIVHRTYLGEPPRVKEQTRPHYTTKSSIYRDGGGRTMRCFCAMRTKWVVYNTSIFYFVPIFILFWCVVCWLSTTVIVEVRSAVWCVFEWHTI